MTLPDPLKLIEAVPLAMLVVDGAARVVLANDPARALFGDGILGRPFVTVLRHPAINEAVENILEGRAHSRDRQQARINAQGRMLSVAATVTPLPLNGGQGAAIAFEDRSGIEQADAMRRDFVANVSHELRTPLTALAGFIETLRGAARDDPSARERFLDIMQREAGRMNRLIGDLLSLSRVEAEERSRPAESVDLAALLRNVVATLSQGADAAGVRIAFETPPQGVLVAGDSDQLVQVFHNLIENAVKYGGSGGVVTLTIESIAHEPVLRGPAWAITVADRGEGIEAQHLPRLTERFYRVDGHRSRERGGTGLGLAIAKHIVNRHRGRLRIESEKGKGSRFTVALPVLDPPASK
ncbi:ATP-binding protein [uncultured Paracoccus sp.]|uniref:sensor histidine kinase n=1 Tax=uncultured Paracoccus sp. TaxID=189685 RepID=UPI0025DF5670|nr:ATP-binding protein [uncultured Paracoccus sp.]